MSSDTWGEAAVFQFEKIGQNKQIFSKVITFSAIVSGAGAGILGLEGKQGFLFYLASYGLMLFVLFGRLGGVPLRYFKSIWDLVDPSSIVDGMLSFILVWTFVYACIYIF
eukprot:PhF_6_TR32907/c0_g1_i1/m.48381